MNKKKILIVIHQLNFGGVQKALLPVLNAIDYDKNEVTLYVRKNRLQLLPAIHKNVKRVIVNEDNTHYYRKPYMIFLQGCKLVCSILNNKIWCEVLQEKIVEYLNKSQMRYEKQHYFQDDFAYDVAIAYIQGYTAQFVAEYVRAKRKIMFYHGSTDDRHDLHQEVMKNYDSIVGVNKNVKRILCDLYPEYSKKITYINNYVEPTDIYEKSKEYVISTENNKYMFCSCGRLATEKGFDLAIEAATILKEKKVPFVWYFVGDGSERKNLESLIEKYDLNDYIVITGMKDNPYPYISGCNIYIQPSYEESFGLTIAEAKILQKPIVSTKTVGAKLQLVHGETGLLVETTGLSVAEGVLKYLNDNELKSSIINELKKINYTLAYKEFCECWKKLLEG